MYACFSTPQSSLEDGVKETEQEPRFFIVGISNNHDHDQMSITSESVKLGTPGTYQLSGGGHTHNFEISAVLMRTLRDNGSLTMNTNNNFHGHTVNMAYRLPSSSNKKNIVIK